MLTYHVDDGSHMRRHADRIIALTDARSIRIRAPYREDPELQAWTVDLPPAAHHLEVVGSDTDSELEDVTPNLLAPAIAGSGATALRKLNLESVLIREWPLHLPSLRYLSLAGVTIEAPFAPGAWCPLLEKLNISCAKVEHVRVDIRLPFLRFMNLDDLDVSPDGDSERPPFGEITIDAPELLRLAVNCDWPEFTADYKSFTLRAPRLRRLFWQHVVINVGRPGSVKKGAIELRTIHRRDLKDYQEQMMRMLEGLLPDLPQENIADVSK
nr:unnamed protein product [Digitaria exilis]